MNKFRMPLGINSNDLESVSWKTLLIPMCNKVSGQRTQLVMSQFESMVMPIKGETPLVESSLAQDILGKSSVIKRLNSGKLMLLKKFKYQDLTYYIFKLNGVVDLYIDDRYVETNNFATARDTDFRLLEENVEYNLNESDEFYQNYVTQFDPTSDTVGYGMNVNTILTTSLHNVQDSVPVSRRFAEKFATLKPKCINIQLGRKKIISEYPNIFPELGKFINNPLLFKVVKEVNLAQDKDSPSGYEDDPIILEPLTYIRRVEVYCNTAITDPILEKYRLDMLDFRQQVYEFVNQLDSPLSEALTIYKNNFAHSMFRDRTTSLDTPLIKIYTQTLSLTETETKFTTLNGGKVTVTEIYDDDKYVDEFGETIDVLYPANSLINRTISGTLYEVYFNSVGRFINKMVKENTITPERLHEGMAKMLKCIGKTKEWEFLNMTPKELFTYFTHKRVNWGIKPYDLDVDIETMDQLDRIAEEYFDFRELKVYNHGVEVAEPHICGDLFFMRLLHDRFKITSGSSIPQKDARGYLVDKSSEKKDGRAIHSSKPCKMSILMLHKILNNISNEDVSILLKENTAKLTATHEYLASVGFELVTTKKIKNRVDISDDIDEN